MRLRSSWKHKVVAALSSIAIAGGSAAGLVLVAASPASAVPVPPNPGVAGGGCTYTDATTGQTTTALLVGVSAGDTVNVVCGGLINPVTKADEAGNSVAIAESSPLAGVVSPQSAEAGFADAATATLTNACDGTAVTGSTHICPGNPTDCPAPYNTIASGCVQASFVVGATGNATHPFAASNGDANATCPPSQAQINAGLLGCALAVADVSAQLPMDDMQIYFGTPTPSNLTPTLSVSPTSGQFGDTLKLSQGGSCNLPNPVTSTSNCWWGSGLQGASGGTGTVKAAIGTPVHLTTALTSGTAVTSLAVSAIPTAVSLNDNIVVSCGTCGTGGLPTSQTFVASAAAAKGATSISVTSQTANASYPTTSAVTDSTVSGLSANWMASVSAANVVFTPDVYCATAPSGVTLTTALVSGNAVTTLAVTALPDTVNVGDKITVTSGSNSQIFTAAAQAPPGSTSISVTSQTANFSYPTGSTVTDASYQTNWLSLECTGQSTGNLIGSQIVNPTGGAATIVVPNTPQVIGGADTVEIDEVNATAVPGTGTDPIGTMQNVGSTSSFTVDPPPAATNNPSSGGQGTQVALAGTNWDPQGGAVTCSFTTGTLAAHGPGNYTGDFVSLGVPNASGAVSGSLGVTSADTVGSNPIVCYQTFANGSVQTATATPSFTVLALSSTCAIGGTTGNTTCSIQQVISATVSGTDLTMLEAATQLNDTIPVGTNGGNTNAQGTNQFTNYWKCPVTNPDALHVTLTPVTLAPTNLTNPGSNGPGQVSAGNSFTTYAGSNVFPTGVANEPQFQSALGCINHVLVEDSRGTLAGWTVNATMKTDFVNATPVGNNGTDCAGLTNAAPRAPWTEFVSGTTPETGWPSTKDWPTGNPTGTANGSARTYNTGAESANGDNCIPAENLIWAPGTSVSNQSCSSLDGVSVCGPSDLENEVFAGPPDVLSTAVATNLCFAPGGGGGGGATCDAALDLEIPPYVAAGTYSATMNISVQ